MGCLIEGYYNTLLLIATDRVTTKECWLASSFVRSFVVNTARARALSSMDAQEGASKSPARANCTPRHHLGPAAMPDAKIHPVSNQNQSGVPEPAQTASLTPNLALALKRAQPQRHGSVIAGAVAAAKKIQAEPSAKSPLSDPNSSSSIVDTQQPSAMSRLGISKIFQSRSAWKRRRSGGRYGTAAPEHWPGAAKLVRDVGETVISVAVSGDDSLFAVGSTNKKAIVYTTSNGATVASFTAKSMINSVVFAGVGEDTRLLAGTVTGDLHMWHVASEASELEQKFGGDINAMAVGAGGTRLAVAGKASHVVVYDLSFPGDGAGGGSGGVLTETCRYAPTGTVLSVSLNADATLMATGGEAKLVQLWTLHSAEAVENSRGEAMSTFRCSSRIDSLALSASGDRLAVGLWECTEVFQLHPSIESRVVADGAPPPTPGGAPPTPTAGSAAGDASSRHSRTSDAGSESVLEVHGLTCEPLLWLECPAQQGGVAFSQEGKLAVAGNQLVTVFDTVSGGTLCKMPRAARVRCVALTSTGGIVVVGGFDRKATLHNVVAGTELTHYACAEDIVRSVHLSADSSRLVIGSEKRGKGCVCLYDVNSGALRGEWERPKGVWCVRLSPDGSVLAAAGYDMKMTVYDTASTQQVRPSRAGTRPGCAGKRMGCAGKGMRCGGKGLGCAGQRLGCAGNAAAVEGPSCGRPLARSHPQPPVACLLVRRCTRWHTRRRAAPPSSGRWLSRSTTRTSPSAAGRATPTSTSSPAPPTARRPHRRPRASRRCSILRATSRASRAAPGCPRRCRSP